MRRDVRRPVRVPPYLLTAGRTSGSVELALDTQVQRVAMVPKPKNLGAAGPELTVILRECRLPTPVVEIAGRTNLPVQVARILIGDLLDRGLVAVQSGRDTDERPDIQLLERVLSGLREAG